MGHLMIMSGLFLVLLSSLPCHVYGDDLASDTLALLSLRAAVGGRSLLWNTTSQTAPCSWDGVTCFNNRVTELRFPGMGFSGHLPSSVIGNLTQLQTLSLRFNALSGPLPADIASLSDLRNLYLQGNSFDGPIPSFLYSLPNLVRLNLAFNHFSGELSADVNKLTRLGTLYLENNNLTGSIPDLVLPDLEQFNISFNSFNGTIPKRLSKMNKASFLGLNNTLCGKPLKSCFPNLDEGNHKLSAGAIAGIVIGSVLVLLIILLLLLFCCRKKRSKKTGSMDIEVAKQEDVVTGDKFVGADGGVAAGTTLSALSKEIKSGGLGGAGAADTKKLVFFGNSPRNYDLEDLLKASAEVLGKGTFGTAYKAVLEMGMVVAVKRLKDVAAADKESRERIEIVGAMNHENLVLLRAYYYSRDEKLLVYDYLPMGSLSALLHGNRGAGRTPLNWESRSGIALGAARGIAYIHSQTPTSSHGNIKSSNILLTKYFEPRVSDFGLAHLVGPSSTPNRVEGYRAPEVTNPRQVSQKADVYSFGVLLLELLTGKAPTHALLNEEGVDLPRWVQSVVREEWTSEVFDAELLRYQNVEDEMVQLLQLAIDCTAQYPDSRPTMAQVASQIEQLCRSSLQKEQESPSPPNNQGNDEGVSRADNSGSEAR